MPWRQVAQHPTKRLICGRDAALGASIQADLTHRMAEWPGRLRGKRPVLEMLGHSSAAMTMDIYGHLSSGCLDEVADALDTARSEAARSAVANAQNHVAKVVPNADVVDLAALQGEG